MKNKNQNNKVEKKSIWNKEVFGLRNRIRTTEIEAELLLKKGDRILKRRLCEKAK
ncbi:MAG: hypothetical protein GY861_25730 [bacterium]|nr:hypothetical protein [bacterium]